ncbi:MAG: hypothetical protein JRN35_10885 [Nitrososphaerota archaeon]|nr:hypothetical protein [Nitrososphaerota archaeon]
MNLTGADLLAHLDVMRREAQRATGDKAFVRIGQISSYDPNRYQAKCLIYPEMHETGWLAIGTKLVGSGYGMLIGPTQGDLVLVHFVDGDYNMGIIGDSFFTAAMPPPAPVESGEVLILHASGSFFKIPVDGDLDLSTVANMNLTVSGNLAATVQGSATITSPNSVTVSAPTTVVEGDLEVTGNISGGTGSGGGTATFNGTVTTTGDVQAGGISLENHYHTYSPGSGSPTNTSPAEG